jgi:hypothetical protein
MSPSDKQLIVDQLTTTAAATATSKIAESGTVGAAVSLLDKLSLVLNGEDISSEKDQRHIATQVIDLIK